MNQEMQKNLDLFLLSQEKMKVVFGRSMGCYCACAWSGTPGGSSTHNNNYTNDYLNLNSPTES
jgi:hypothetical protein